MGSSDPGFGLACIGLAAAKRFSGAGSRRTLAMITAAAMLFCVCGKALAQNISTAIGANGTSTTSKSGSTTSGTNASPITLPVQSTGGKGAIAAYTSSGTQTVFVYGSSQGGQGGSSADKGPDSNGNPQYYTVGGNGGAGAATSVTVGLPVSIDSGVTITPSAGHGVTGVAAVSQGGSAGVGNGDGSGNIVQQGGGTGNTNVTSTASVNLELGWGNNAPNSTLYNQTNEVIGIGALSKAGSGTASYTSKKNGGAGGPSSSAEVDITGGDVSVTQTTPANPISYNAAVGNTGPFIELFPTPHPLLIPGTTLVGAAVVASSWGGAGGAGYDQSTGGSGGIGTTATIRITDANITSTTPDTTWPNGSPSVQGLTPAVLAESFGGPGGNSGIEQDHSTAGAGGTGGGVNVSIATTLGSSRTIETTGVSSTAIIAVSSGGNGGVGQLYDNFGLSVAAGGGGAGGAGSAVSVNLGDLYTILTHRGDSNGIYAYSSGGAGGNGGEFHGHSVGNAGAGGNGGNAGDVSVTIGNSVLRIAGGIGVWAASTGGTGGTGGFGNGTLGIDADGGNGGNGGNSGAITVTTAATTVIATAGENRYGIAALGTSGNAGAAGGATAASATPGVAGAGGNTGAITVNNGGFIETAGAESSGILAQPIAGSGGAGGTSSSPFYGQGTAGGAAGTVAPATITNTGVITTVGLSSPGIQVQSIGGGGGAGSVAGLNGGFVEIGGDGGPGGDGGQVTVTSSGTVQTSASTSAGVLAQSIGGGGGSLLATTSTDGVGIGGAGGQGGNGGPLIINAGGLISTAGTTSIGVQAQSIGGGGGAGGESESFISVGGSGSGGGNGGTVTGTSSGTVQTAGSGSHALVAQSIGGGGGSGGDATDGLVSVGGSGGATGVGGTG